MGRVFARSPSWISFHASPSRTRGARRRRRDWDVELPAALEARGAEVEAGQPHRRRVDGEGRADGSFNVNRAEDPSGERRSQIDRTLFRGRAAVRYLAVWNAPAYPDRPLTAPEKARGPWTTKDYLSRVLQETSNEMVDALLAATQADLINAFCRMHSISGCFLLFAVRRPRGAAASKKEKVA